MANKGRFQKGCTPHNKGKAGLPRKPKDPDAPFVPYVADTLKQQQRAQAEFMKMVRGMSTMAGLSQGIEELDIPMIVAMSGSEDPSIWSSKARDIARVLFKFASKLKEGAENATQRTELEGGNGIGEGAGGTPECAEGAIADQTPASEEEPGS